MHVEWVADPTYSARQIRLRPEEYRRLWAAVRGEFRDGRAPNASTHTGYGPPTPSTSASARPARSTPATIGSPAGCASPGSRTRLWSPFADGLVWRYRKADQST